MADYRFRILNVFAVDGDRLSGNPLCVFEDARGIADAQMQALALQFNLSETTFILPSERATARVRIFTPTFEMPFAGHPTLGTAHVVRDLRRPGDAVTLEEKAGVIPVIAQGDTWTLTANAPKRRAPEATAAQLAEMLGIDVRDVGDDAAWIDTGVEQLVVPLKSTAAVARCAADPQLLDRWGRAGPDRTLVYAWGPAQGDEIHARFFFGKGAAVAEDPATGSACANLGGWFVLTGAKLPLARTVLQGGHVGRPSRLTLRVDAERRIHVSGLVIEVARGTLTL
jgi:trans-2,3-dihydro-3-hydroxyanthranilate isomerase